MNAIAVTGDLTMSSTLRTHLPTAGHDEILAALHGTVPRIWFDCTDPGQSSAVALWPDGDPVLAEVVHTFGGFGLFITSQTPLPVPSGGDAPARMYRLYFRDVAVTDTTAAVLSEALQAALDGHSKVDAYSQLVLAAGLNWREVMLIRAACRFLTQSGIGLPENYIADTLVKNPRAATLFTELFTARFDPETNQHTQPETLSAEFETAIESTTTMDADRILRGLHRFVQAVLRTNWFQKDSDGQPKNYVSFKLDSASLPANGPIVPFREIFVYSDWAEGVHVRSGPVSRGGLRWSDRIEDYRTEVLGLMKTQVVKNSPIVPVGAKGAFIIRGPVTAQTVRSGYGTFIRGLLDLTDNIIDGTLAHPQSTVRVDGEDSYLVVAADKGTAQLSDLANSIAAEYNFWLGDAFASGGSNGYDHKAMGITARGAWLSVRRHLSESGHDPDTEPFTVVGIGDMSGDVFGNGMLLSEQIRLVGAFDHRHIFLDPNPVPAALAERRRLFDLPGSSWADFDPKLISAGGGVWSRQLKRIELSEQTRALLDVTTPALTPDELIKAILRAPVDLLWNGGIGTYVKASTETPTEAADPANDAVRVNADELRCAIIGEGGNLGLTQPARIQYALAGGRINADFIDNAAGVATSDLEVNIKIALDAAVTGGTLTHDQRSALLAAVTEEVAASVLADSDHQTLAITLAEEQATALLDRHGRFIDNLERGGGLDRAVENLPSTAELAVRAREGRGLTRPEIAVLLAQSKNMVRRELLQSAVPDNACFEHLLRDCFPSAITEAVPEEVKGHRLRREIIATRLASDLINHAGPGLLFWLEERFGTSTPSVALAYQVVRAVFDPDPTWHDVAGPVTAGPQFHHRLRRVQKLIERATAWLLVNRPLPIDPGHEIRRYRELFAELVYTNGGPDPLDIDGIEEFFGYAETARALSLPIEQVQSAHREVGRRLRLQSLNTTLEAGIHTSHWDLVAFESVHDDLREQHHMLTAAVLAEGGPDAIDRWCAARAKNVNRFTDLIGTLLSAESIDLPRACTASAELRLLTRASPDTGQHTHWVHSDGSAANRTAFVQPLRR